LHKIHHQIGIILLCVLLFSFCSLGFSDEKVELEIACFQGGYGLDFFLQCAREFEKLHPHVKVNLWGNPRVWDQLIPRFSAGTPPDLSWPGWGINMWALVFENQILQLDHYLQQPAYGVDKKWIDTFNPIIAAKGKFKGKYYIMQYNFDAFGIWYNINLFKKHGWNPPKTYEELLDLCEKIKQKNISPMTFTGRYPSYAIRGIYYPWVISWGGEEVYEKTFDMEPGAWKDPAFLKAAQCILEMKHKKNFQPGCIGMNHTESQMEFLVERAAMIPCGTWLHSEMRNLLPPDFKMGFFVCPGFKDGKGDPSAICAGGDGKAWIVPAKSKHPELAIEFLKYMSSPQKARQFMEQKGTLMAIKDLDTTNAPEYLKTPLRLVDESNYIWNPDHESWYPSFAASIKNAFLDLYNEIVTPEQFVEQLEKAAQNIRNDPSIQKFKKEK